jgi:hypothetical protein
MNEITVTPDELQILLNLIDEEISVMYPLYKHFNLFKAVQQKDGYRLKIMQGKADFDEQQNYFSYADEMPSYSDFLECLLSSGIIYYENFEEFAEAVRSYENLKKTVLFCPDTNILYHRFMTNSGIDFRKVLLVNVVRDEIEASLNFKYSPTQIAEIKRDAKYQPFLLDEFVNRRMKRSRLACLALTEYRELRRYAVEVEGIEPSTNDKEQNDLTIVKTLRRFERERAAMPVMLTADRQMADLCEAEGVEHFHFLIPHAVNADFCSHSSMLRLMYSLAMVFGVFRLDSVVVFGEFKGKKKIEELKLRFLDDNLQKKFEKHLKICRRLMKLGIKR